MKFGKAKILFSIFCLVAAMSLAAFAVYAWFFSITTVSTGYFDASIRSGDVLSFKITYYSTTTKDGLNFTIGEALESEENEPKVMPSYGEINPDGTYYTAVLIDMELEFAKTGTFDMTARTHRPHQADADPYGSAFDDFTTDNILSNVVYMRRVENNNIDFTAKTFKVAEDATQYSFITNSEGKAQYFNGDGDGAKKNTFSKLPALEIDEDDIANQPLHIYYVIDYMDSQINALYSIMLKNFQDRSDILTASIHFKQDIYFEITRQEG